MRAQNMPNVKKWKVNPAFGNNDKQIQLKCLSQERKRQRMLLSRAETGHDIGLMVERVLTLKALDEQIENIVQNEV